MNKIYRILVILIVNAALFYAFVASAWSDEYRIGALFPLSGNWISKIGSGQSKSLRLLVDQLNKEGGVNGKLVKLIVADTQGDRKIASAEVQKIILKHKPNAIIGPTLTGTTLAVIPFIKKKDVKVPLISCASGLQITKPIKKWIFQTAPNQSLPIDKVFEDMVGKNIQSFAPFGPYQSADLLLYIAEKAKKSGLRMIEGGQYEWNANEDQTIELYKKIKPEAKAVLLYDLQPKLSSMSWVKILKSKATPLYVLYPSIIELNISPTFPRYRNIQVNLPTYLFRRFLDKERRQKVAKFSKSYMEKYGERITKYDIAVYDAFMIIVNSIRKGGGKGESIREYIENTQGFWGITGVYNFSSKDHNGLSSRIYVLAEVNESNGCSNELHKCENCKECADSEKDCSD